MKNVVKCLALFAFVLTLGAYVTVSAQEKSSANKSVTGCLQKGDEPNEYSIKAEDGKTYGLRSKTVDLSKHLGHKVTASGRLRTESAEQGKAEAQETKSNESTEAGDIRVTDLHMVSEQCQ